MQTLSEQIKLCKAGAANNPYQGTDKKVLFVCSMGILRSATGARLYGSKYNTRSAGTYDEALIPLTVMLITWADEIVFVNKQNFVSAVDKFGEEMFADKDVKVLGIPDTHPHMDPVLVEAFKAQYEDV